MMGIEVNGLVKNYGDFRAVDHVSFAVETGEFYALMGPNGSGKSTVAAILATVNRPTDGSAGVMGFDVVSEAEQVRKVINYVPDLRFSSVNLTGEENLILYARLIGLSKSRAKEVSRSLLRKVGLSEAAKNLVSTYSSGMRRRLEIASGLIGEAPVLILDEPTTALDPSVRRTIMGWLLEELEKDRAILFITHIGKDAEAASRVAFMMKGKIMAEGTPGELKSKYVEESIINVKTTAKMRTVAETLKDFSADNKVLETEEGYRLYSNRPEKSIPLIVEAANKTGCRVLEIDSVKPTLEDAFFKMTGAPLG